MKRVCACVDFVATLLFFEEAALLPATLLGCDGGNPCHAHAPRQPHQHPSSNTTQSAEAANLEKFPLPLQAADMATLETQVEAGQHP